MKTSSAAFAASFAFAAAPTAETVSLLDWMLDGAIATRPAASQEATVAAVLTMVDLEQKVAAQIAAELAHPTYKLLPGAEGFACITGRVGSKMAAKLQAMGGKHVLRHGGSWSFPTAKAKEVLAIVIADADAACPVCKLSKSKWGKRCPGKPVA
jgi:hypothetical protein